MKIFDGETERNMTDDEIATMEYLQKSAKEGAVLQAKAQADKVAARQAVLDKLGLTADEVTALLG